MTSATDITYARPPLIETALGAQFPLIAGLTTAHLGAFWRELAEHYPKVEDAPALQPQHERFGDEQRLVPRWPRLQIAEPQPSRVRMSSADGERMVQVQNGRLVVNWLRADAQTYTRFVSTLAEFTRVSRQLVAFLRQGHGLDVPKWDQWEVTYVNHLPRGEAWHDRREWPDLLPGLLGRGAELPVGPLESAGCEWHYEIAPRMGRLHVELTQGWPTPTLEGPEALILQLTARGPLADDASDTEVERCLRQGHDVIVQTFDAVIGDRARAHWGRQ